MGRRADNSFFHESYEGTRVLVAVPHQDDEILTSAAMTLRLTEAGAEVFVVYTTNGDWKYPARVRYREAAEAASRLGIEASHLYFLGYGDSYNNEAHDHLFYYESGQHASTAGHTCTYGAGGTDEYAYMRFGEHHAYNSANYLRDLMSVIREISPVTLSISIFQESATETAESHKVPSRSKRIPFFINFINSFFLQSRFYGRRFAASRRR
jgi:LmbE family N-acetylglucosaminyl deacetylase